MFGCQWTEVTITDKDGNTTTVQQFVQCSKYPNCR